MTKWDKAQMDEKLRVVLDVSSHVRHHHFGRPFLTPYQIAIRFSELFPVEAAMLGLPVGGRHTGQHDSLAQYIANELSKRIKSGKTTYAEGRFLYRGNLRGLQYSDGRRTLEASSGQSYDLSLFRLVDQK